MKKLVLLFLLPAMMLGIVSCGAAESISENASESILESTLEVSEDGKDETLQQGQIAQESKEKTGMMKTP